MIASLETLSNIQTEAKKIAFLIQNETNAWDITARKLVENGRFTYQKWYEDQSITDQKIVDDAINVFAESNG